MQNLTNWDIHKRVMLLYKVVCVFFLTGIAISLPLWHGQRIFPLIPVLPGMPAIPAPFDYILLGLLIAGLLLGVWRPDRRLTMTILILTGFMIFMDQMRLQPWVLIYFLVLIPYSLVDLRDEKNRKKWGPLVISYIQILLVGVYLWSGLHKFTPSFVELIYPMLLKGLFRVTDGSWWLEYNELGYAVAIIEVLNGIGLIFPKTRKVAALSAILSHLLIMAWISPLGGNTNYVVLPWNMAMILLVLLSAWGMNNKLNLWPANHTAMRWATAGLVLLVWIMPALNLKEKWDAYLSFNLYTERISHMYVGLRGDALAQLDKRLHAYFGPKSLIEDGRVIDVDSWSFEELKVPVYPALRVHKAIGRHFCKPQANPDQIMLATFRRPFKEGNYEVFFCKDC